MTHLLLHLRHDWYFVAAAVVTGALAVATPQGCTPAMLEAVVPAAAGALAELVGSLAQKECAAAGGNIDDCLAAIDRAAPPHACKNGRNSAGGAGGH